jgi:hypothetical protein
VAGRTVLSHSAREQVQQVYSIDGRLIGNFKLGEIKKLHSGLYLIGNDLKISPLVTTVNK